jgi:hypothetical protein
MKALLLCVFIACAVWGCGEDPSGPNSDDPAVPDSLLPPVEFTNCLADTVLHPDAELTLRWTSQRVVPPDSVVINIEEGRSLHWRRIATLPFSAGQITIPVDSMRSALLRFRIREAEDRATWRSHTGEVLRSDTTATYASGFALISPAHDDTLVWQSAELRWLTSREVIVGNRDVEIQHQFAGEVDWSPSRFVPAVEGRYRMWGKLPEKKGGRWHTRMRVRGETEWSTRVDVVIADLRFVDPASEGSEGTVFHSGAMTSLRIHEGIFMQVETELTLSGSTDGGATWMPLPNPERDVTKGGIWYDQKAPFPLTGTDRGVLRLDIRRGSSHFTVLSPTYRVEDNSSEMWSVPVGRTLRYQAVWSRWERYVGTESSTDTLEVTVLSSSIDSQTGQRLYPLSIRNVTTGETTESMLREEQFGMHRLTGWILDKRYADSPILAYTHWDAGLSSITTVNNYNEDPWRLRAEATMEEGHGLRRVYIESFYPLNYKEFFELTLLD